MYCNSGPDLWYIGVGIGGIGISVSGISTASGGVPANAFCTPWLLTLAITRTMKIQMKINDLVYFEVQILQYWDGANHTLDTTGYDRMFDDIKTWLHII